MAQLGSLPASRVALACLHAAHNSHPLLALFVCSSVQANVAKIAAHNARPEATYRLGLNAHADLTTEEFGRLYFGAQ